MSHFTRVETQIRDPQALDAAVRELGLTLIANGIARGYAGNTLKGEFVIKCKGPYDIAVNRDASGNYGLTCDWWQGHVAKEVGEKYQRLVQLYGVHKATAEARRRGLTVQRQQRADGSVKLTIAGMR